MSSLNRVASSNRGMVANAEGTLVRNISAEKQLVRMTLANLLWEDSFYVDGKTQAQMLAEVVGKVSGDFVATVAKAARTKFKLRHVPLLLMRELARSGKLRADDLDAVILRPDEMGEFVNLYWNAEKAMQTSHQGTGLGYRKGPARMVEVKVQAKAKKEPLSNQVKKGLAKAFVKFNEYQLAKWDKNSAAVSVRDVMFLTHPKPLNAEQEALFKRIAAKEMQTPDTWETELSAGADKRETFERLMAEGKLGALAFLRNLRNMVQSGISTQTIDAYSYKVDATKVLPFRYIAAYRIVPEFRVMLERMMFASLASHKKLPGKTKLYVDVSGSMFGTKVSGKSELDRFDAAAALAILAREICEEVEIYSFSERAVRISNNFRGFGLVDAISNSQRHSGTMTQAALKATEGPAARVIIFTDEQSHARVTAPGFGAKGYIVNVADYKNGINHGAWTTVTGFSEAVIDYIQAVEDPSMDLF